MKTKYDELRESGKRKRLTYREQEPQDPAQHELWRLENAIEDGELVDIAAPGPLEITESEAAALGMIHAYLKKMCGRREVCKGCPWNKKIMFSGYGDCSEYAAVQILVRQKAVQK